MDALWQDLRHALRLFIARRWLGAVVVVEVAVAVILLVNGRLVVQSFTRLQDVSLGFDPQHLLTMQMTPQLQKYPTPADRVAFVDRIIAQVAAVPGVTSAGITTNMPLQHMSQDAAFTVEGHPRPNPADVPITAHRLVTPVYLETLGVRLVKGRLLNEHDRAGALPVAVVTEALAKEAWPNEDPIGRHIRRGRLLDTHFPWLTVAGVVADVKEDRFNFRIDRPAWYLPYAQQTAAVGSLSLVVRASGDPPAIASAVRGAIRSIDPQQSVSSVVTMTDHVADLLVTERFTAVLMTTLASVGLLLAAFGLNGVVAYSATQRTVEIGLRMALGAKSRDVMRLVMGQAVSLVALGLAIGWLCARGLSVTLAGILYGVDADDPATFAAVTMVLAAVGLAAGYLPARRATRVDPMTALRGD